MYTMSHTTFCTTRLSPMAVFHLDYKHLLEREKGTGNLPKFVVVYTNTSSYDAAQLQTFYVKVI